MLRDGKYIDTVFTKAITNEELIKMMIGRTLENHYPQRKSQIGEVRLAVKNITLKRKVKDISFDVHKGEILGLFGLVGAGRTETVRAIFGADPIINGTIEIDGETKYIKSPKQAIENGIALLPEDRKQQGVLLRMSIKHNITFACVKGISKLTVVKKGIENAIVKQYINRLSIKTPYDRQLVKNLSGGNQQKVALAKWLATNAKIIIFDEPTRGIDVGAKHEIYELMNELVRSGIAIIMISSDMPELIGMSDRVVIMYEGRKTGELLRNEMTPEQIMLLASGNRIEVKK